MIAAAVRYRETEKNTPPDFSTKPPTLRNSVFCQKAPRNSVLRRLVQAQDPANDPNLFFDPATGATVTRGFQSNTFPFRANGTSVVPGMLIMTADFVIAPVPGDQSCLFSRSMMDGTNSTSEDDSGNNMMDGNNKNNGTSNDDGNGDKMMHKNNGTPSDNDKGGNMKNGNDMMNGDNNNGTDHKHHHHGHHKHCHKNDGDNKMDGNSNNDGENMGNGTKSNDASNNCGNNNSDNHDGMGGNNGTDVNDGGHNNNGTNLGDGNNSNNGTNLDNGNDSNNGTNVTDGNNNNNGTVDAGNIGNFGSCSVPEIQFGAGFDGRRETSFEPVDKGKPSYPCLYHPLERFRLTLLPRYPVNYNHGSAQNIDIITQFMCDQLVNTCKADDIAKSTCAKAKIAADGAPPKTGKQADAFNAVFGKVTDFASVTTLDNQGNPIAARSLRGRRPNVLRRVELF